MSGGNGWLSMEVAGIKEKATWKDRNSQDGAWERSETAAAAAAAAAAVAAAAAAAAAASRVSS